MTASKGTAGFLVVLFSVALSSCDPPGKPKGVDAQAIDREKIMDFATLYEANCSGCHGVDGKNGAARTINQPLYLAVLPKDTLREIIRNGRPGTVMPAWVKSQGGPLTDQQVEALVNAIYKNWGKPVQAGAAALPAYSSDATGDAAKGKRLYGRNCFLCHGTGAAVGPVTDTAYLSLVSNQYLRSSILFGRPDLGMPDYRSLALGHPLSEQDVADLVAYLASLRPPDALKAMQDAAALQQQQQQQAATSSTHGEGGK